MFNKTELAGRWKISVRTLQDWRRLLSKSLCIYH
jgi:hypothetical protein